MNTSTKTRVYNYEGITSATDAANIYYINTPRAARMEKENKQITISDIRGLALAIFKY